MAQICLLLIIQWSLHCEAAYLCIVMIQSLAVIYYFMVVHFHQKSFLVEEGRRSHEKSMHGKILRKAFTFLLAKHNHVPTVMGLNQE